MSVLLVPRLRGEFLYGSDDNDNDNDPTLNEQKMCTR